MRKWTDTIDPATIPDAVLIAERARRNNLRRATHGGGAPRKCNCEKPTCRICKNRNYQARKRSKTLDPTANQE